MKRSVRGLLLGIGLLAASGASAQSMRCDGYVVAEGDRAEAIAQRCGPPDFRDHWAPGNGPRPGPPHEQWVYNNGPRRLLQVLSFRGDRVQAIDSAGYGFRPSGIPASGDCEPSFIQPGIIKYRLIHACGWPAEHTGWYVFVNDLDRARGYPRAPGPRGGRLVFRERWRYRFGRNRLLREIQLENGVVTDVIVGRRALER